MSVAHRAGRVLLAITAVLGVVAVLLLLLSAVTGVRAVVVRSGSMSPDIPTGSLLLTHRVTADDVTRGDVVTVPRPGGGSVTHRVVAIAPAGADTRALTLKGDANSTPDPAPYVVAHVGSVLVHVPVAGAVIVWFSHAPGSLVAAGAVALLVTIALRRPSDPPPAFGRRRETPRGRRESRRPATRGVVAVTAVVVAVGAAPASALWQDSAPVAGSAASTTSVKPSTTSGASCATSGTGLGTTSTTWLTSPVPDVVYSAAVVEAPLLGVTVTKGATSSTASFRNITALMVNFTTIRLQVTATKGQWTSTSTRIYTVVAGIPTACGSWT